MSTDIPSTCFVINPYSAGGRTARHWEKVSKILVREIGSFSVRFTESIGDATRQTRLALAEGNQLIISVGGDGTNNEIVNGFFDEDGNMTHPDAMFSFFPSGSGSDLRRTLSTAENTKDLVRLIRNGSTKKLDLGCVTYVAHNGEEEKRFFINIASFGASGLTVRYVNKSSKPLGGSFAFAAATVKTMLKYKNTTIRVSYDDGPFENELIHVLAVSNGRFFGGGMQVAPDAEMDDGIFDVITLGDVGLWDLITNSSKLYKGTHLESPKINARRAKKVVVECEKELFIEIDGEQPGHLPATFEILPKTLSFRGLP